MKHVLLGMLCAFSLSTKGQSVTIKSKEVNEQGVPTVVMLENGNRPSTLSEKKAFFSAILPLKESDDLVSKKLEEDEQNIIHDFYEQYYKGIRVEDGAYIVHSRNGHVELMNGSFQQIENLDVFPAISENEAFERATDYFKDLTFKWQSPELESKLKRVTQNALATYKPKGELLIWKNKSKKNEFALAYKFIIELQNPDDAIYTYVDAKSGRILWTFSASVHNMKANPIKLVDVSANAATRYSGNQTITTDQTGPSTFRLRETGRGGGIQTINFNSGGDFTDNDNNWTANEFDNAARDNAALDVHWAMERSYDYWLNVHNRNSYNNQGALIRATVHAQGLNTLWNANTQVLQFSDGGTNNGMTYAPLTSLDICAHEFGHAIFQGTGNSATTFESASLNEGFSDIWGSCVEAWAAPNKNAWITGEEVISGGAGYERSLINPLNNQYPTVYNGLYWDSQGNDTHRNATVLSHCFYLISEGGFARNTAGAGYSISGIGRQKAEIITYLAERAFLPGTPNPTFVNTRDAMVNAAVQRYGSCSAEAIATTNAWYAAGIGTAIGSPFGTYSYGNNTFVFNSNTGISVSNSSPNIFISLADYGSSATYNWTITSQSGNSSKSFSGRTANISLSGGASLNITCTTTNSCGTYSVSFSCYNYTGGFRMAAYPNPASQDITVAAVKSEEAEDSKFQDDNMAADKPVEESDLIDIEADVQLLDRNNAIIREGKLKKGRLNFSLAKIPDGIYYLFLNYQDKQIRKQIIIQH